MTDKNIAHLDEIRKGYFNVPIKDNAEADMVWQTLVGRQLDNLKDKGSELFFAGFANLKLDRQAIPKVEDLHESVHGFTKWNIADTDIEYTSADDWFDHLKNKQLVVTTFIRSKENIDYTPFPDGFHDIFGHLPLMTIPKYADLIQKFGRIYLSLPVEKRQEFTNFWWYAMEFGLIKEKGKIKALGAGLISSVGELFHAFSKDVELARFERDVVSLTPISDHAFHKKLFVLDSWEHLERELASWETKKCVACEGEASALSKKEVAALMKTISGWQLKDGGKKIARRYEFKDFKEALDFVNRVGALAESENHHPDIHLDDFKFVAIELWTHAVGGISQNDFIFAEKVA